MFMLLFMLLAQLPGGSLQRQQQRHSRHLVRWHGECRLLQALSMQGDIVDTVLRVVPNLSPGHPV